MFFGEMIVELDYFFGWFIRANEPGTLLLSIPIDAEHLFGGFCLQVFGQAEPHCFVSKTSVSCSILEYEAT